MNKSLVSTALCALILLGSAQMFAQPDREPTVNLRFDRYYDHAAVTDALQRLQKAFPKFLTL